MAFIIDHKLVYAITQIAKYRVKTTCIGYRKHHITLYKGLMGRNPISSRYYIHLLCKQFRSWCSVGLPYNLNMEATMENADSQTGIAHAPKMPFISHNANTYALTGDPPCRSLHVATTILQICEKIIQSIVCQMEYAKNARMYCMRSRFAICNPSMLL